MQIATSEGLVIATGTYSRPDDADPIAYRSGALVEFLSIVFDGDSQPRQITLAEGVQAPAVYSVVTLEASIEAATHEGIFKLGRDGRSYVPTTRAKDKWRCTSVQVVREAPMIADDRLLAAA